MKKKTKTKASLFPSIRLRQRVNAFLKLLRIPFKFTSLHWRLLIIFWLISLGVFSYLTNPFVKFSLVKDPYPIIKTENGQFLLNGVTQLQLRDTVFSRNLAKAKAWWHVAAAKFTGSPIAKRTTVDEIIRDIHETRFNPQEPFLISGDHFSVLYPRSLGIFYNCLLDPRTALDEKDWRNRQLIYLKTLAYALQVYSQSDKLSTTIVPIGRSSVALMNIWTEPSDTLYSLLFALKVTQTEDELLYQYPFALEKSSRLSLRTNIVSREMQDNYKLNLQKFLVDYQGKVFDQNLGLISKNITLSSTKDTAKRESAFYDNVIYWKTLVLAQDLDLIDKDEKYLAQLKTNIIDNFWNEKEGIFIEDLSQESLDNNLYSSDWLIAYMTGFLDPNNETDREYLTRSIDYIQRNALNQPFALQYHADKRPWQTYGVIRISAANYASTAIWSNWGMEYIKLLNHLAQLTGDEDYLREADRNLQAYAFNIKRYRGYPEVYNEKGDFFRSPFYKSIRTTGWVVSFEQAKAMHDWTKANWHTFAR